MKKLILLFLLFLPLLSTAQVVNIPDANFKAYLVGNNFINTNGDGEIQVSEASVFTGQIFCANSGISDLTGIEAFTALTYLSCQGNLLTNLNVSSNIALLMLQCSGNLLITIDVSNNILLNELHCQINSLTSLDITNNPALWFLWCNNNSLTSLDLRNGNNINMDWLAINAFDNPDLYCISVDNETWSNSNWINKDSWAVYSNDCATVGIEENEINQPSITSYNNTITIKGKGTTSIYNLRGQRVHQSKLTGKKTISLGRGIYLVRVISEGRSVTKKIYLN
ncbi:MAG: T9SS type A sorting domain-containing protein [Bacteroidetes bacterium]|nr:T9SS type A sorting domain-containing protein [Bacteroidota bacterium]